MLKLRLRRTGRKHDPSFRIVVSESSSPARGKYLESVGSYNSRLKQLDLDKERVQHWLSNGAQPTDVVHNILVKEGVIEGKKIAVHSNKPSRKAKEEESEEKPAVEAEGGGAEEKPAEDAGQESSSDESKEEQPKEEAEEKPEAESDKEEAPVEEEKPQDEGEEEKKEDAPEESEDNKEESKDNKPEEEKTE